MSAVIYNCKRCKVGRRVEYGAGRESNGYRSWPFRRDERGRRQFPGAYYCGVKDGKRQYDGDPLGMCAGCGMPMAWGVLQACHRPEVRCDARCTSARGFKCDCSCGGENHGAAGGMFTGLLEAAA